MTPEEKAEEFYLKYQYRIENRLDKKYSKKYEKFLIKQCALIAVNEIINSNPHSNPLNTEVYSTMDWWQEIKQELEKL